jgi:hypothetical protein
MRGRILLPGIPLRGHFLLVSGHSEAGAGNAPGSSPLRDVRILSGRTRAMALVAVIACACLTWPGAAAAEPAPSLGAGDADSVTWIEPGAADDPPGQSMLKVSWPEGPVAAGEAVEFHYEVLSPDATDLASVLMTVLDSNGMALLEGNVDITVRTGVSQSHLRWEDPNLPDGVYTARFQLLRPRPRVVATQYLTIRRVTGARLAERLETAATALDALAAHLAGLEARDIWPPYPRMRMALAEDYLPVARRLLAEGDWRRAEDVVAFLQDVAANVRSTLSFASLVPELTEPGPAPDLSALEVRDGAFFCGDRPVFLFGGAGAAGFGAELPNLQRYGLNFAAVRLPSSEAMSDAGAQAEWAREMEALFQTAEAGNISVLAKLSVLDQPVETSGARALRAMDDYVKTMIPVLAGQDMLSGVCVAERPAFRFNGEAVRQGFIDAAQETYGDRNLLNRTWRTRLRGFEEITIDWPSARPAYRYDWLTYHQKLGTRLLKSSGDAVTREARDTPVLAALADTAFDPGEAAHGIDREALADRFDFTGCVATVPPDSGAYLHGYLNPVLQYTLLRSFAPDKPLVNVEDRPLSHNDRFAPYSFEYVHTLMWGAAIAGLNASATPLTDRSGPLDLSPGDMFRYPACMNGYATACLDLNRLADVVHAFQQAPAHVAVLWSMPSKIYQEGEPYLDSAREAFMDTYAFGYKTRFITERQCIEGELRDVSILVLPYALLVEEAAFAAIHRYAEAGGVLIRRGEPVPYDERRQSRKDLLPVTPGTVYIGGNESPAAYLGAMDLAQLQGVLEPVPRPVTHYGYPIEGVVSRYLRHGGAEYLYIVNLRDEPMQVFLRGGPRSGRDLIHGRDVAFPDVMTPLEPMLIRLDPEAAPDDAEALEAALVEDVPT